MVADSRATKKVVILDCCFSGRALADQAGDEESFLGQVGIEGTYLLTATAANAVALAPPGERYTAFTGALLGLLNRAIPDGPELLTLRTDLPPPAVHTDEPPTPTAPPAGERHYRPPRPEPQPGLHQTRGGTEDYWKERFTAKLEDARQPAPKGHARKAEARRLAASAEFALTLRGTSLQIPIALAVESLRMAAVLEADVATRHAIRTAAPRRSAACTTTEPVGAVACSPDGAPGWRLAATMAARGCSTRRPALNISPAWTMRPR